LSKKFILSADNLGSSKASNQAILESYSYGLLRSATVRANAVFFDDVINSIIPQCPNLGIGISLEALRGKSICTDLSLLTDDNLNFNNSFLQLLIKSYNPKEIDFLDQVEREFRRQIEKLLSKSKITHISLPIDLYLIPKIFKLTCRLAKEYQIPQVRILFEKLYFPPLFNKCLSIQYFINVIKDLFLMCLSKYYRKIINEYDLLTNDYSLGILYQSKMNSFILSYGLSAINTNHHVVEMIIYPCRYEEGLVDNHFDEFLLSKNLKIKEKLEDLGYEIANYAKKDF
jgi:predicted glycoside hydrolase/deacetylase ChbG (UPF0249 family)